jgi:porin
MRSSSTIRNRAASSCGLDTDKAFGMQGGIFNYRMSAQIGDTFTGFNAIGSEAFVPVAFGNELRLVDFNYAQGWFNHALQVTVGRMQAGYTNTPFLSPGFHQTDWYSTFASTLCGTPAGFANNSSKVPYDVGTWGGSVTVHLVPISDRWYIKAGVFGSQPDEVLTQGHDGWPGRDWGFDQIRGVFIPVQLGYVSPAGTLYPTNFHIAGYYDNAKFVDKYLNANHQPIATHPGAPLLDRGTSGMFGAIQQTVYRFSDDPYSIRGISLFAAADWDLGGLEQVQQDYDAGFVITGLIPQRSVDTINFLSRVIFYDPREVEGRNAIAAVNHVDYHMHPQVGFELNYGFVPTPGMTIYPFTQYIINPDQTDFAIPRAGLDHAYTVGLRALIRFADVFGMPRLGGPPPAPPAPGGVR